MATPPQGLLDPILLEGTTLDARQLKRVLRSLKGAGDPDEPRYQYSTLAEGSYRLVPPPPPEEESDARASTTTERAADGGDCDIQGRPGPAGKRRRINLVEKFDL